METLKPETYWIGNRCYRINPGQTNQSQNVSVEEASVDESCKQRHDVRKPYIENDEFAEPPVNMDDEIAEDFNEIVDVTKEDNGFKVVCNVPASLFSHIIGSKGTVKKRIETETRTRIYVPRQNEKGDIVVRGQSKQDVIKGYKRVEQIALNARQKREATHFVCFPMNNASVVQKCKEFRDKVQQDCGMTSRGLDKSLFQEPSKLHLTICIMVLLDERERRTAADILSGMECEIRERIEEGPAKLRIRLKGLEIMNDDPTQVHVLYAKCQPMDDPSENTVQDIAELIKTKFVQKGLGIEARGEKVKLHCTLMNTRYRGSEHNAEVVEENKKHDDYDRSKKRNGNGGYSSRESFDARPILKAYGDFDFGTVEISEVKIATRYTTANDGFYKCNSTLTI